MELFDSVFRAPPAYDAGIWPFRPHLGLAAGPANSDIQAIDAAQSRWPMVTAGNQIRGGGRVDNNYIVAKMRYLGNVQI